MVVGNLGAPLEPMLADGALDYGEESDALDGRSEEPDVVGADCDPWASSSSGGGLLQENGAASPRSLKPPNKDIRRRMT